jgi:hypothetical protein
MLFRSLRRRAMASLLICRPRPSEHSRLSTVVDPSPVAALTTTQTHDPRTVPAFALSRYLLLTAPPRCPPIHLPAIRRKAHRGVHEQITTGPPAVRPFLEDDHGRRRHCARRRCTPQEVAARLGDEGEGKNARSGQGIAIRGRRDGPIGGSSSEGLSEPWHRTRSRSFRPDRPRAAPPPHTYLSAGRLCPPQARWSRSRALIPPRFFRCPLTAPRARRIPAAAHQYCEAAIGVRVWLVHLPGRGHQLRWDGAEVLTSSETNGSR